MLRTAEDAVSGQSPKLWAGATRALGSYRYLCQSTWGSRGHLRAQLSDVTSRLFAVRDPLSANSNRTLLASIVLSTQTNKQLHSYDKTINDAVPTNLR